MILCVGFDYFLEKRYYLDKYSRLGDNQVINQEYDLGGNSINCVRVLKGLNLDVFATGFLGGLNGSFILNGLMDLGIQNDFLRIKDETPNNISVYKDDKLTFKLKENNSRITREEVESFYKLFEDISYKYKYICALGEVPDNISQDIYFHLIKTAKKHHRKVILDTSGEELKFGLDAIPYMAKLGREDLENLCKIKTNFESEVIRLGYTFIEKGVEILVIDLDENGSIVLLEDSAYRLEIPKCLYRLNKDKGFFVSGFVFGLMKNYDIETVMKLGQGMRIAYGKNEDLNTIDMSDVKRVMVDIEIRKINY